jgi:hypothetical protein
MRKHPNWLKFSFYSPAGIFPTGQSGWFAGGSLLMGAAGQFFLAQDGHLWTFWLSLCFYGLGLALLFKALPPPGSPLATSDRPLSRRVEAMAFFFLAGLTVFFRVYHTNQFPEGVFADRAEVALGALRILHEHWRPFLEGLSQHVPEVCVYYMAALWIGLFGSSPGVFSYFDATLSILGVLGFYGVYRLWVPARTALLAFFFLAVMRWNFAFGHQIYYQCQTVLFMAPALGFLFYGLRKGSRFFAALGGGVAGLGLYSYQAFKAFPLLALIFLGIDYLENRARWRERAQPWAAFWLALLLSAAPLAAWMGHSGEVGRREAEVSVLTEIQAQKSLEPLWRNLKDAAFMFNRRGDTNTQSNFQAHRMLDDATGVFFVLGLGYAFRRLKDRPFGYALAGLGVLNLPSLLSINGGHAGRMLGTTPFTALLCALVAAEVWDRWKAACPDRPALQWATKAGAAAILVGAGFQNFQAYFHDQASDPVCRNDCSWSETTVGRAIAGADPAVEFFLPSRFYGHPTVMFLTYPHWERMHPLDLARLPRPSAYASGASFCFWEDDFKQGVLGYLGRCYPGGRLDTFQGFFGENTLYAYRVPPDNLRVLGPGFPRLENGLYGVYKVSGEGRPFLERWDPLINFTFRDLPFSSSPLLIHWTAKFKAEAGGAYSFLAPTWSGERARILLDGNDDSGWLVSPNLRVKLKPGWHRLDLDFQKGDSPIAALNLLWKRPGQDRYEFMPNDAFGPVR